MKLKVYEYEIRDVKCGTYKGSYTLREDVEPRHYLNEKVIQVIEMPTVIVKHQK